MREVEQGKKGRLEPSAWGAK